MATQFWFGRIMGIYLGIRHSSEWLTSQRIEHDSLNTKPKQYPEKAEWPGLMNIGSTWSYQSGTDWNSKTNYPGTNGTIAALVLHISVVLKGSRSRIKIVSGLVETWDILVNQDTIISCIFLDFDVNATLSRASFAWPHGSKRSKPR